MLKLLALLLVHLGAAVVYYDCDERGYCNAYREHLIWGGDETKFDFGYYVDSFTINEEESSISLDLSLSEHLVDEQDSELSTVYEPSLSATLSFYANGAMRVEVDDPSRTRFKISDIEIEDLVINSQLEKVADFASAVKEHEAYYTVSYQDTNG